MAVSLQRNNSKGPSHRSNSNATAQIIFKQPGSLYVLTASQWNKLGKGSLSLIFNPHNARELVFKLKTENDVHIFQLKPKLKPKGGSSWVLKATNTRTNKEDILAVRFNSQPASDLFRQHVEWADKQQIAQAEQDNTQNNNNNNNRNNNNNTNQSPTDNGQSTHDRLQSITPSEMRSMLPKQPWDCPLCTFRNPAAKGQCGVCNTPRPILRQESGRNVGSPDANNTPILPQSLQVDNGQLSAIFAPQSPNASMGGSFDFSNSHLPKNPTKETDVQSTLADFRRILTMIESNITYQDPAKFFTDLRKVAKRLQRPDMKFRCLDLNNPVVKSRLMQVEGVDAYLSYLGFVKDDLSNKLICPEDQPPQSVILAAQEACKQFIEQAAQKQETLTRMRKFSIQEKRRESSRSSQNKYRIDSIQRDRATRATNAIDRTAVQALNNPNTPNQINININTSNSSGLPTPNTDSSDAKESNNHGSSGLPTPHPDEKESDEDEKLSDDNNNNRHNSDDSDEFTLKQLVWSVTHERSRDDKTQDVLLLSHSVFATSMDLFNVLVERFNKPDDQEILSDDEDGDNNTTQPLSPEDIARSHWNVQVKVGNMMRHWIKNFYEQDFAGTPVVDSLYDFFDSMENDEDNRVKQLLDKLKKTLEQQELEAEKKEKQQMKSKRPGKDLSNVFGTSKKFKLNDQNAQTIAEQITLMDFKIFKEIQKRECLGQSWKKKDGRQKAPNILAMIDQFNRVSKFVQVLILMAPDIRKRCKVIRKCIKIACHLKDLRNFSSLCAFNSALISTPIHRLKDAWNVVPQNDKKKFDEIREIFAMQDNWKTLRKMHREAHAPAILHTGLFLQDIVAIDEGNDNKLKDGKVNFKKLLRLYEKIDTIYMYQQSGYDFKENLLIQKVIKDDFMAQEKLDEDYLWRFSTDVKEKDKARANNRIWQR